MHELCKDLAPSSMDTETCVFLAEICFHQFQQEGNAYNALHKAFTFSMEARNRSSVIDVRVQARLSWLLGLVYTEMCPSTTAFPFLHEALQLLQADKIEKVCVPHVKSDNVITKASIEGKLEKFSRENTVNIAFQLSATGKHEQVIESLLPIITSQTRRESLRTSDFDRILFVFLDSCIYCSRWEAAKEVGARLLEWECAETNKPCLQTSSALLCNISRMDKVMRTLRKVLEGLEQANVQVMDFASTVYHSIVSPLVFLTTSLPRVPKRDEKAYCVLLVQLWEHMYRTYKLLQQSPENLSRMLALLRAQATQRHLINANDSSILHMCICEFLGLRDCAPSDDMQSDEEGVDIEGELMQCVYLLYGIWLKWFVDITPEKCLPVNTIPHSKEEAERLYRFLQPICRSLLHER